MQPISRRMFLAGSAAVVVSAVSACSDDDGSGAASSTAGTSAPTSDAPPTTPETVAPAPTQPGTTDATTTTTTAPVELPGDPFTLGVASGDPSDGAVVLWTRLAPDPLHGGGMPDVDVAVTWEVARDESFADVVATGTATAAAEYAHSVHVRAALDPGWWWYRFRVGTFTSPSGRTQPIPTSPAQVRFATASCQNYQDGFYTAHADIAAQQLDAVVFLGDYIYEGGAAVAGEGGTVRTHGTPEADTLEAYRDRYALYKSDPDLRAAHASCPWYVTWDDHEVENNYAGLAPADASQAAAFPERRRAAYQAWWEHQPVDLPPPASAEYAIHRGARWGDLLEFSILDGRQHRTDQACGDPSLSLDPPCPETFDPARTMLGAEQQSWLLDRLATRAARWHAIAQQTVFGDVTIGGAVLSYDQWDGYPAARNVIVDALDPAAATVVLTGDIHFAGAGTIRKGGRGVGMPVGVEFVTTSISSGGRVNPAVTDVVRQIPDIVDVELEHRGWILHTVTPDRWSAEYRMVETVKQPDAPVYVHATFVVDAGTNTVQRTEITSPP